MKLLVPVSPGELVDKITILSIKAARITDFAKLRNVRTELTLLMEIWMASACQATDIKAEWGDLRRVNAKLWDLEDYLRDKEREGRFDDEFIAFARSVYVLNDERAALKRQINVKLGSALVEEKSYAEYRA